MHFQEKYLLAENIFPLKAGNWLIRVFSGGWESSLDAGWREAWASGEEAAKYRGSPWTMAWRVGGECGFDRLCPGKIPLSKALPLPEAGAKMRPDNRLAGFSY